MTEDARQQLISFLNPNNQIHPFSGWSVEICNDKLYFILHKPGEPGKLEVQTERHILFTFSNRFVFFDSWNNLVISCQNNFQKKVSEIVITLNNKNKVLKLSVDREMLFHSFDLISTGELSTVIAPTVSTRHKLNDLWLFKGFQGKVYQCLVFKNRLSSDEVNKLNLILNSIDELNNWESHHKIRNWIIGHHLSSKLALDFNAFDLRHRHISILADFAQLTQRVVFSADSARDSPLLSDPSLTFLDSSSLSPVVFSPVALIPSSSDPRSQSGLMPFRFNFGFFSSDPFKFDYSLFQQNFNIPFLLCLKPLSQLRSPELWDPLYLVWTKTITNFFSKPRLAVSLSATQIETRVNQLLGTLFYCTFTSKFDFFPPKICDLYLDILNSLDLTVSVHLLNCFFIDRVFLFKLSEQPAHLDYFITKLAVWFIKYRKIRELVDWKQLFENLIFFLAISDFADQPLDSPHFRLACRLGSFFLFFFPFSRQINESLLIFLRDLRLDCFFAPIWLPASELAETDWATEHFAGALNVLKQCNQSPPKNIFVKVDLKLLLFQLNSPLLIKSAHKTALLLDLLFLLLENHSLHPCPDLFTSTVLSLLYDYKNNSGKIIVRCFALFLKSGHTLDIVPASLFNMRKFNFSSAPIGAPNQSLLTFIRDDSYKILCSNSLIEYLFSLFLDNYSISGFFDHERLNINDSQIFQIFFSLARLFESRALEKSLQIFSIFLKHSKQENALSLFSSTPIMVALLDLLYRFALTFRDEDDLKDKAYFFLKQKDSSLASRMDLSRQNDLHQILLYFEGHNTKWENFFQSESPRNAVFDLTLRMVKLILDLNRTQRPCPLELTRFLLIVCVYYFQFRAYPMVLQLLPLFFSQFDQMTPQFRQKDSLLLCLVALQAVLIPIDLNFFSSTKHVSSDWFLLLDLLQHWLSSNNSVLLSYFPLRDTESLLKKNRFKILHTDKRFPVLASSFRSEIDFCFLDFIPPPSTPFEKNQSETLESSLETIFLMSKCVINITHKVNATIKAVKALLSPEDTTRRLEVDIHLLGTVSSLSRHLEVLLLISRHSSFKRRSSRLQNLLPRVIGIMSKVLYFTIGHIGRVRPNSRLSPTQGPLEAHVQHAGATLSAAARPCH